MCVSANDDVSRLPCFKRELREETRVYILSIFLNELAAAVNPDLFLVGHYLDLSLILTKREEIHVKSTPCIPRELRGH